MKFIISCEVFARLSGITSFFMPSTPDEIVEKLKCIRIENKNGKTYAITTNYKIAAIEMIGTTNEADGVAHVITDSELIQQCKNESSYGSFLEIITIPEIATASVKSMMGYVHHKNPCIFPDETPMDDWLDWPYQREPVTVNKGAMFWNLDYVKALFEASPSGKIVFPAFIDIDVPVVMRDRANPNWVGLFMGAPKITDGVAEPAVLPEWWS